MGSSRIISRGFGKKIAAGKIDNNDMAVETIAVNIKNKTVAESAHFIIDSKESGIGVNASVFCHGIALLNCHRTAHFSVWKTPGASALGMSHLLHGFV